MTQHYSWKGDDGTELGLLARDSNGKAKQLALTMTQKARFWRRIYQHSSAPQIFRAVLNRGGRRNLGKSY